MPGNWICRRIMGFRTSPMIPIILTFILLFTIFPSTASAGVFLKNGSDVTENNPIETIFSDPNTISENYSIQFFYSTSCGACHVAMVYLNEFSAAHPEIVIDMHDLDKNAENRALFEQYKKAYNRDYVSVPSLFIGNAGLEGQSAIRDNFEALTAWYEKKHLTDESTIPDTIQKKPEIQPKRTVISIPLVLIAGVVDGINPCACAVIIFLLILLMVIRDRLRILLAGTVFSSAVFFFYFLSGVGLFSFSKNSDFIIGFSLIAGIGAAIAGVFTILIALFPDFFEKIIPTAPKEGVLSILTTMTIPITFILGLLMGILELPCTGGIYIAILDMIAFRVNMVQGLLYLILYNLAFIIPLMTITGLVYWGKSPHQMEEAEPVQQRGIGIFIGLLLFVFALLTITGVV